MRTANNTVDIPWSDLHMIIYKYHVYPIMIKAISVFCFSSVLSSTYIANYWCDVQRRQFASTIQRINAVQFVCGS